MILDLVLPGIPGLEVIHALQSTGQNIPIIVTIGADRRSGNRIRASAMGASKLLRKPVTASVLAKWVKTVLEGAVLPNRTAEVDDTAAVLLPLTERLRIPPILERLGKRLEGNGYYADQLRCGAISVDHALDGSDWSRRFGKLLTWSQKHEIAFNESVD